MLDPYKVKKADLYKDIPGGPRNIVTELFYSRFNDEEKGPATATLAPSVAEVSSQATGDLREPW